MIKHPEGDCCMVGEDTEKASEAKSDLTNGMTSKQASIFICPINKQRYNIDE